MGRWTGIGALAAVVWAPPLMAQSAGMTREQAKALYGAGGFPVVTDAVGPTNRCGKPARPRITFVDMNGDGRKEALFIDSGDCYQQEKRWYAVATQDADGRWRRILEGEGSVAASGTAVNGWFVLNATRGGVTTRLAYDGNVYADARMASQAARAAPSTARNATSSPAAAAPAGDAAIFLAAGFHLKKGRWESGCNDGDEDNGPGSYGPGTIEERRDLNGDGRPEAIITEGGTYCYGNTGAAFWVMSQQADGRWKRMYNSVGIADIRRTKGADGWPDIGIGGPGFCMPVVRWNGRAYVDLRVEGKGCAR